MGLKSECISLSYRGHLVLANPQIGNKLNMGSIHSAHGGGVFRANIDTTTVLPPIEKNTHICILRYGS